MNFKNFYVPLNESEEDYTKQTELGKKLGLEHTGKGVYVNKSGDKYFYNKSSNTFSGWKGKLDPNNPEHHVKPSENLEARKESLEKDIKEKDLSKNKDGSDFEEYDTLRFKPREVHERFEVHGHNFVVHDSRRSGGRGETYDKLSISHESGLPVIGGTFPKKAMEQNVEHVKKFFGDFRDHEDLKKHLNKLYSDVAHDDKFYPDVRKFKNVFDFQDHNKLVNPLKERFEKHLGEDVKKSHEKRNNNLYNGFNEKVGDRIYVDYSHFTPRGGMGAEGAVDRHNKTGRQVLFDDKEGKYYLSDKVVEPYDHEAFLKRPDEQTKYKTLGGETKYTQGGHTDPYEKPKTPEDKHFSEVKKQQIEMAHNVIRNSYEKMEGAEKRRALEQLGSGQFANMDGASEHGKKFNKAGNYLKELSKSGLKQIHSELSGVPLEKKKTGKFTINLKDSEGVSKSHEIKYSDSFEIHGHEFVAHKRADYDKDGNLSLSDKVMDISHKDTGLLVRSGLDPKKRQSEIEETKAKLNQIGKEKLEQAIEKAKAK